LTNRNGHWQYENYTWEELSFGKPGLIKESSGNVLTLDGKEITLTFPDGDGSDSQLWTLGIMYKDGSFTLRNPTSGGYLTATSETSTSAEGNITSDKILFNIYSKRHCLCSHFKSRTFNYYRLGDFNCFFLSEFCSG
jgi:hypothetical protein